MPSITSFIKHHYRHFNAAALVDAARSASSQDSAWARAQQAAQDATQQSEKRAQEHLETLRAVHAQALTVAREDADEQHARAAALEQQVAALKAQLEQLQGGGRSGPLGVSPRSPSCASCAALRQQMAADKAAPCAGCAALMAQLAATEEALRSAKAQLADADTRAVAQLEALTTMHAQQLADAQRRGACTNCASLSAQLATATAADNGAAARIEALRVW